MAKSSIDQARTLQDARKGISFIVSSPSGAGKTTITRKLLQNNQLKLSVSISMTTRQPRKTEKEGFDYIFVSESTFFKLRAEGKFLEWAMVHNNYYGTPKDPVIEAINSGTDMLFDIDWQGAKALSNLPNLDCVKCFILPPSLKDLRHRLYTRAQDPTNIVEDRLNNARHEIPHWEAYDYVLINDNLEITYNNICSIIIAERHKLKRNKPAITSLVKALTL